jgi:hypothetical protein
VGGEGRRWGGGCCERIEYTLKISNCSESEELFFVKERQTDRERQRETERETETVRC